MRAFNKKYTFSICVGRVWTVIRYFLFEKQTFNGLFKVIRIQKGFLKYKSPVNKNNMRSNQF